MTLSPKKTKAITALLECKSLGDAAARVGASVRQVQRWLDEPEFRRVLDTEQAKVTRQVYNRLVILTGQAVDVLEELLTKPEGKGAYIRRLVANDILDQAKKYRELTSIEERLQELEGFAYAKTNN